MKGGDLSNAVPPRCLVHLDVVTVRETVKKRKWGVLPRSTTDTYVDRLALNRVWQFGARHDVSLDLFATGISQADLDVVVQGMEATYTNPFRWAVAYPTVRQMVAELPYRPEVIGVIDLPERAMRYGSLYLDLTRIP